MESVALVFLGLIGALFLGIGIQGLAKSVRALSWMEVTGHISMAGYDTVKRADTSLLEYHPWIEYRYRFNGRTYNAGRYYPGHVSPFLKEDAIDHVASHPSGTDLAVWVNPRNAFESTTVAGIEWSQLVPAIFGALMTTFAVIKLWW